MSCQTCGLDWDQHTRDQNKIAHCPDIGEPPLDRGLGIYTHPKALKREQMDPLIADICFKINESGWVWTAESCQGHPDATREVWAANVRPFLRLVCKTDHLGGMLAGLLFSSEVVGDYDMKRFGSFEVYPYAIGSEWCSVLVYIHASTVYHRDKGLEIFRIFAHYVNTHETSGRSKQAYPTV